MHALDTNALVRLLVRDDAAQAKAADEFIAKGAWVSHVVLAETLWVLSAVYERSAAQLVDLLDILLAHQTLVIQDADTVTTAIGHFRRKPTLGFSDCLVLEIAHKAGHTPLGTFDKGLAKLQDTKKL